jgi:hypothetical protein
MSVLHEHPILVFVSGITLLVILQNEKARVIASLLTFIVVIIAIAQILGFDLKL